MIRNLTCSLLVCSFVLVSTSAEARRGNQRPVYYVALGTSLAAGVQADPVTGESIVTDVSYPGLIADGLQEEAPRLRLINLGCPGETSSSFIEGGLCDYRRGSQLNQALRMLRILRGRTGLITMDMGANDILPCFSSPDLVTCFEEQLTTLVGNLDYSLSRIRRVAGPRVPIVAMNYYNPLLATWFTNPELLPLLAQLQAQLNASLEAIYAVYDVDVVDVAGVFQSDDIVSDLNGNGIPDSVELICAWTWMCPLQNIHPNETGYGVIANAFLEVLPMISATPRPHRPWCR